MLLLPHLKLVYQMQPHFPNACRITFRKIKFIENVVQADLPRKFLLLQYLEDGDFQDRQILTSQVVLRLYRFGRFLGPFEAWKRGLQASARRSSGPCW